MSWEDGIALSMHSCCQGPPPPTVHPAWFLSQSASDLPVMVEDLLAYVAHTGFLRLCSGGSRPPAMATAQALWWQIPPA